ncbi:hypothetical protein [Nocardia sp. A7]|uniref:hypothetical protein n=1 Tax=Nocardia sp. A7 TaxID=2789274 RepID=UPI00397BB1AC
MVLQLEVMPLARKPEVFVRAVPRKGWQLEQIARCSDIPVRMRRAVEVVASAQHQPVGFIAMQVSESHARQMIHGFNARGFGAPDPI